jgi:hypothetical protein
MSNTPTAQPSATEVNTPVPQRSASGEPVTRAYRIAFQVWVTCVLLTVVITLSLYLFDKIYLRLMGR